jgi:hypothetical protein
MTEAIQTHSRSHYDEHGTYIGDPLCARCQDAQRNLELALIEEASWADGHVPVAEWTRGAAPA